MADKIFLISESGALEPMTETPCAAEVDLQELLATHAELLPGDQIDSDSPRRWLFVGQEVSVSDSSGGVDRWSVDHLFLDQDGIPTIVETKRSSDTRLRREVIGQLLEYAANAVVYWPVAKVRADFEATCVERKQTPADVLRSRLGINSEPEAVEAFWATVEDNLSVERVRLILVADNIAPETHRIVEFLNGQMAPAEFLAVEVRQFASGPRKVLVPRVLGQTAKAEKAKAGQRPPPKLWDEALVLSELASNTGATEVALAEELIRSVKPLATRTYCQGGAVWGSFYVAVGDGDDEVISFRISSTGHIQYELGSLIDWLETPELQSELSRRVNDIPGNEFSEKQLGKYPGHPLARLSDPAAMRKFKDLFEWVFKLNCQR